MFIRIDDLKIRTFRDQQREVVLYCSVRRLRLLKLSDNE
ncbi:hypothetical protein AAKU64_004387 [Undibacterium sp. GrIS 1.8]